MNFSNLFKVEYNQIYEDLIHPSVTDEPEIVRNSISVYDNAYSATQGTHAIVICTEWDEFIVSITKQCLTIHNYWLNKLILYFLIIFRL